MTAAGTLSHASVSLERQLEELLLPTTKDTAIAGIGESPSIVVTNRNRYALRKQNGTPIEVPQFTHMRIAMGLSYNEPDPTAAARGPRQAELAGVESPAAAPRASRGPCNRVQPVDAAAPIPAFLGSGGRRRFARRARSGGRGVFGGSRGR